MALDKETKLKLAIGLATTFMIVEIFGGYVANSLAIFSDAAHLLTDIAGFGISLLAVIYSKRPGCKDYTYGLARAEVFGALGSILSLWLITAVLVYEAYNRGMLWLEGKAEEVNGKVMFFVAIFGVFVNLCLGLVFSSEHGGAFHPAHSSCSHDHDHSSGNHHTEESHQDQKSPCSGHDHSHNSHSSTDQEQGHKEHKPSGHDHSHGHLHSEPAKETKKVTEKSSLLKGNKVSLCSALYVIYFWS
jgi:zinc transporter 2